MFYPHVAAKRLPVATPKSNEKNTVARFSQYAKLPMRFEARQGQFLARGDGYSVWLNGADAVLKFRAQTNEASSTGDGRSVAAVIKISLVGAQTPQRAMGEEELPTKSHYFLGNNPTTWRTDIANFARVKVEAVYPGIDLVWYGNQRNLEHDFLLAPGADPRRIKMSFTGAEKIALDRQGNLKLTVRGGELELRKPQAWQDVEGERREVACNFRISRQRQVEFQLGAYDARRELVIDPVLAYSSLIGGASSDQGSSIAVDVQGAAYITGATFSTDFPVVNPLQANSAKPDTSEAFILKINPAGTAIVYSTYLGGDKFDDGRSIAVDATGNVYVCGRTESANFPTTASAPQRNHAGLVDGFVAKLNPAGSALVYSTLMGGNLVDQASSLILDAAGNAYVTGQSDSTDFPSLNLVNVRQGSALYRSANGGSEWTAFANGMPAVRLNTLVADPKNPAIVYAAGRWGFYKSTDSGATWAQTVSYGVGIVDVVIDPVNTSTLYALFEGGGYLKSVNGGSSFDAPVTYPPGSAGPSALAFDPKQASTIYAGDFDGMFKSLNGGTTWQAINNGLTGLGFPNPPSVSRIIIDSVNPSVLYIATSRGVFKSADAGATWRALPLGGIGFHLTIDPANPQVIYAGSRFGGGVWKTTNGGESWMNINNGLETGGLPPAVNAIAIDPTTPAAVYAATTGLGIFKTTDGGANWAPVNGGLNNQNVFALLFDPANAQRVLAGTDAGADAFAAKLNPAGTQWSYIRFPGGFESDIATSLAVDAEGAAYLTGTTTSTNFPVLNAVQPNSGGGTDAFVMKLGAACRRSCESVEI